MLRVPYESMRKTFKSTQRHLERNIEQLRVGAQDLVNLTSNVPTSVATNATPDDSAMDVDYSGSEAAQALSQIDGMIGRVKGMKRKMSSLKSEHERNVSKARARIDFLSQLCDPTVQDVDSEKYKDWSRTRLNMLLVDYCLRNGQPNTAMRLASARGIEKLVDIEELQQCNEIERSLRTDHVISKCQAWCSENRQFLKKIRSNLEFQIKFQQYIELVRDGKPAEAIQYYRQNLIKNAETKFDLMMRASGLLAFRSSEDNEPYNDLYSPQRWDELADMFVQTFQELHGLPHRSLFLHYLATGITALKTHSCEVPTAEEVQQQQLAPPSLHQPFGRNHRVDLTRGYMCPVCSIELRNLAQPLPYALHHHSHLDADPVMLPNSRIYGKAKLDDYAKKAGIPPNKIVDPVTREIFDDFSATKVFPT